MINLDEYTLVSAESIKQKKGDVVLYDIEVENTHNFFIHNGYGNILTHNCDGGHITSLIINFFYKWFPNIIKNGKLFRLVMPLISLEKKGIREYFDSINEFNTKRNVGGEVRYLKGLGSYDIKDWEYIFSNKKLLQITLDSNIDDSTNILEMAFGNSSKLRKDWLIG